MRYEIATYTETGTRELNEDSVAYRTEGNGLLLVVADGLGGHEKGEVASNYVAEYITSQFHFDAPADREIGQVIKGAQLGLLKLQREEKSVDAMKTTVVCLAIKEDNAFFAHVGDSRGYMFDKRRNYIRTLDHSVPQMLALSGGIKEKEIRHHSERSSLLRVLGSPWEKDAFEVSDRIDTKKAKAFLLCSDGFWELIEEKEMMKCLKKSKSPAEWLEGMAERIKENGKGTEMDNFTAGAVFVIGE